jgi:hypothetical protein
MNFFLPYIPVDFQARKWTYTSTGSNIPTFNDTWEHTNLPNKLSFLNTCALDRNSKKRIVRSLIFLKYEGNGGLAGSVFRWYCYTDSDMNGTQYPASCNNLNNYNQLREYVTVNFNKFNTNQSTNNKATFWSNQFLYNGDRYSFFTNYNALNAATLNAPRIQQMSANLGLTTTGIKPPYFSAKSFI